MSLLAAPPDVLRWSPRSQGHGDCAVAAIELACGISYEQALGQSLQVCPKVLVEGLTWAQIRKVISSMGFTVHRRKKFDLDDDTGILGVTQLAVGPASEHVVYLWEGRVVEPSYERRQLWLHAQDFLSHYHYTTDCLFEIEKKAGT